MKRYLINTLSLSAASVLLFTCLASAAADSKGQSVMSSSGDQTLSWPGNRWAIKITEEKSNFILTWSLTKASGKITIAHSINSPWGRLITIILDAEMNGKLPSNAQLVKDAVAEVLPSYERRAYEDIELMRRVNLVYLAVTRKDSGSVINDVIRDQRSLNDQSDAYKNDVAEIPKRAILTRMQAIAGYSMNIEKELHVNGAYLYDVSYILQRLAYTIQDNSAGIIEANGKKAFISVEMANQILIESINKYGMDEILKKTHSPDDINLIQKYIKKGNSKGIITNAMDEIILDFLKINRKVDFITYKENLNKLGDYFGALSLASDNLKKKLSDSMTENGLRVWTSLEIKDTDDHSCRSRLGG